MHQKTVVPDPSFISQREFQIARNVDWLFAPLRNAMTVAAATALVIGSLALLPIVLLQGRATRRRVPILPPAKAPHHGRVSGDGEPIRLLAIGESSVSGIGVARGEDTVAAVTARALARQTGRSVVWRALGLSGATVRDAIEQVLPRVPPEPTDLVVVGFGVNDATSYRSPKAFADDLEELVQAVRHRVGDAAVVVAGVAPLDAFPALPWPMRNILGWRSALMQAAVERLPQRLGRLVVERFSLPFTPDLFASDKFHPNAKAHRLWGEEIATLALALVDTRQKRNRRDLTTPHASGQAA